MAETICRSAEFDRSREFNHRSVKQAHERSAERASASSPTGQLTPREEFPRESATTTNPDTSLGSSIFSLLDDDTDDSSLYQIKFPRSFPLCALIRVLFATKASPASPPNKTEDRRHFRVRIVDSVPPFCNIVMAERIITNNRSNARVIHNYYKALIQYQLCRKRVFIERRQWRSGYVISSALLSLKLLHYDLFSSSGCGSSFNFFSSAFSCTTNAERCYEEVKFSRLSPGSRDLLDFLRQPSRSPVADMRTGEKETTGE